MISPKKAAVVALFGIIALACTYQRMPIIQTFTDQQWMSGYGGGRMSEVVSVFLAPLGYLLIAFFIGVAALLIEFAKSGDSEEEEKPDRCPVCRSPLKSE